MGTSQTQNKEDKKLDTEEGGAMLTQYTVVDQSYSEEQEEKG